VRTFSLNREWFRNEVAYELNLKGVQLDKANILQVVASCIIKMHEWLLRVRNTSCRNWVRVGSLLLLLPSTLACVVTCFIFISKYMKLKIAFYSVYIVVQLLTLFILRFTSN